MNTIETGFLNHDTTLASIAQDIVDVVSTFVSDPDQVATLCDKLKTYRLVHTPTTLHRGKHVRWMRKGGRPTLSLGGMVVDVRSEGGGGGDGDGAGAGDGNTMVHILTYARQSMQYLFEDYVTFQKLTDQEMLVLLMQEHVS